MAKINCNLPFQGCPDCIYLEPKAQKLYCDGDVYYTYVECANYAICRNAFDIWKRGGTEEDGEHDND